MSTERDDDYRERIERERAARREFFRESPRSPLPVELRGDSFPGLAYFDPDPAYRFVVPLHEYDDPETVTVETTADGEQTYRRVGEFRVDVGGEQVAIQAYRPEGGADRLWVPFRDETCGEESYGAGRYVDLKDGDDQVDGEWVLDLNDAYNPTCAYNHAYECPLIPRENWLDVRVEAGERDFPAEPAGDSGA